MVKNRFSLIGAGIVDVLAGPVDESVFAAGSRPVEFSKISFGGDALNEAAVLAKLGGDVELVSKVGNDDAGKQVLSYLQNLRIDTKKVLVEDGLATGVNIVLVDKNGERSFLTNPNGSLRKLAEEDVMPCVDGLADYVGFASIFVSPLLDIPAMTRVFASIKAKPGRLLFADMTKAKNGETIEDLKPLLSYIDYLIPNEEEIAKLTGVTDPEANAELLLQAGVKCAVIKCGKKGCYVKNQKESCWAEAYPDAVCVDTTGAGDSFAAGFIWATAQGMSLKDCGRFACATASFSVEHPGATEGIPECTKVLERFEVMKKTQL